MNQYESGGDDQSEDGQLRTPEEDDISHFEDEGDTADSLDIKPPQANRDVRLKDKKSSKEKKHSREHRHKERDRGTDREREEKRHRHRAERGENIRFENVNVRSGKSERGDMAHFEQFQNFRQPHRERDHEKPRDRDKERSRDRKKEYNDKSDGDKMLEDLRSRLLSKYEIKKRKNENEKRTDERYTTVGVEYENRRIEKEIMRFEHENRREKDNERRDHHYHRENKGYQRERKQTIEIIESPEQYVESNSGTQRVHKERERRPMTVEDKEQEARRAKLLEADREMARRKELAREELEARREMLRERQESKRDSSSSPQAAAPKKRRNSAGEIVLKRKRHSDDVVTVSDNTDDDNDTLTDTSSSRSDDEDDDDDDDDDDDHHHHHHHHHHKEESDGELPNSPSSGGGLSKQEIRRQRRTRSRTTSHSRSRSRSRSRRDDTKSRSRSTSKSKSKSLTPKTRSTSKSPPHERRTRSKSPMDDDDDEDEMLSKDKSKNSDSKPKVEEPIELKEELPPYFPAISGCRSVEEFQCLNRIEEGTYGVVYRAKDKRTEEIVALKRLKMEKEKEGFPITSLREINTLLKGQHPNIVTVREIVVGSNMDKIFIVMDYVEHDLKSLMETMKHKKQVFLPGEVKCLIQQLLKAVAHLHDNWILHRDLKTSNLLLSHKGILKVGDFGLAREYGSPLKAYTSIVVTLWYRAPELLLCCKEYSIPIDMWSVGCIFAEFLAMTALFPGKSEVDQLNRIFKDLGTPNERIWPGYNELPAVQRMTFTEYPVSNLRRKFAHLTSELGLALLQGLLTYDPKQRLSAETALKCPYFKELPLPIDPAMFPTWPAKSELGLWKPSASPKPPSGGSEFKNLNIDDAEHRWGATNMDSRQLAMGPGFSLKF